MEFSIPESRKDGFVLLAAIEDTVRTQFISELLNYPIGYLPSYFIDELADKFSFTKDKTNEIITSIVSLITAKEYTNVELPAFIDGIIAALKKDNVGSLT